MAWGGYLFDQSVEADWFSGLGWERDWGFGVMEGHSGVAEYPGQVHFGGK